jgi:beta-galactosidase
MTRLLLMGLVSLLLCALARGASFDADWRFTKGDPKGADQNQFDDSSWQQVNVPHDWAIEGPFDETAPERGAGAFLRTGVGWYRKHFAKPDMPATGKVFIDFDGVMGNSDVFINSQNVGHRPYGYSSFRYDLTPYLKDQNVLAVRCDNSQQPASRWYAGAGIYRHVRLVVTGAVHFEHWGNFVTTPKVSGEGATIHLKSTVVNESTEPREVMLTVEMHGPNSKEPPPPSWAVPAQTIPPGKSATFEGDIDVPNPRLWSLEEPNLYSLTVRATSGQHPVESETIPVGIRHFEFKPDTGFWLNGKNFKLHGVCVHAEGGAFGAAVPMGAWEHRLKALKELGANSIRTAHNPPDPAFLDLCDRMGFVVMDETFDCWTVGKNPYDYHLFFKDWFQIDARDLVLRDRNHPSVMLYSAGNEIHDTPKPDIAKPILRQIVDICHENDPTRPVTQALFRPNVSGDFENGLAAMLDVVGTNYRDAELLAANAAHPTWPIVGTENRHDLESWLAVRDNPQYSGQFLWTGVDYLGESRRWPVIGAGSGLVDRCGEPKARAWERQSWWSDQPMVKIARRVAPARATAADPGFEPLTRLQSQFRDWTPANLESHEENVEVYSNCDTVELLLNGKSLGSKDKPKDESARAWKVKFEPGNIKAIAKNGDKVVATDELNTVGKGTNLSMMADAGPLTTGWDDVRFVKVSVVEGGGVVPAADNLITFKITGPGVIAAVDNADNASHESFRGSQRHAYQGTCFAMVKATGDSGTIHLEAASEGLTGATIDIPVATAKRNE